MDKDAEFTVLLVDDDQLVRSVMRNMLQLRNYRVVDTADPLEALTSLRSGEPIDLLISDVRMPGSIDGEQFVKMARAIRPDLKVLFVTGHPADLGQDSIDDATTYIMTKPIRLKEFLERIADLLPAATNS